MEENAITHSLRKIINSQRKVNAIVHSLTEQAQALAASGNIAQAYTLKDELIRIQRILERLEADFHELDIVRVSRIQRAAARKERQQIVN